MPANLPETPFPALDKGEEFVAVWKFSIEQRTEIGL